MDYELLTAIAQALGVSSPWEVMSAELNPEEGTLTVYVDFPRGSVFTYTDPETGETGKYKAYDTQVKTWRHLPFFQYRCYIQATVPRVKLPNGKVRQVQVSWAGH